MTNFRTFLAEMLETTWGRTEAITAFIFGVLAIIIGSWLNWMFGISIAIFCLLWVDASYRTYSKVASQLEASRRQKENFVSSALWDSLAKEFYDISPHINAIWKDGVWKLEGDSYHVAQCRALFEKAGAMFYHPNIVDDPCSKWLDLLRNKGHFQITMFNGIEDIRHGGTIAQVPLAARVVCMGLAAACFSSPKSN